MILCPSCLHPRVEREQSKRSVFYFFGIALLVSVCYKVVGLKPRPMEKIACASLIQEEKSDSVASLYHRDDDANSMASLAKYIFGVSTGHAGSTTAHEVLGRTCGNASIAKHFEMKLRFENDEKFGSSFEDPCVLVRTKLLPAIFQERGAAASFVDLGHFHNRGPVVECLAKELGSLAAFINLRRNRYDIAVSFTREFRTPCFFGDDKNESALTDKKEHPSTSYCPLDGQPLIHLPVPRKTWNDLTSFQKFLWQADEVTLRYSHMKSNIPGPRYYELIWSTAADLENGLSELREMFGCEEAGPVPNKKGHVSHKPGVLNCTEFVLSDLQYRQVITPEEDQRRILFDDVPQRLDPVRCQESAEELQKLIDERAQDQNIVV